MTISEYLNKLYQYLGGSQEKLHLKVEETPERVEVSLELPEEEASLFIGSHGETLESLEVVLRLVFQEERANKTSDEDEDVLGYKKIILDINDYKKIKEEKLKDSAIQIAHQVLETGRPYVFGYLNSYERYLIHTAVSEDSGLVDIETFSEDEGARRVLVVQVREDFAGDGNDDSLGEDNNQEIDDAVEKKDDLEE